MDIAFANYEIKSTVIPGIDHRVAFDEKMKKPCWICSCQKKISDLSAAEHEKTCPNKDFFEHLIYIIGPKIKLDNCPLSSRMIEIFNRKTKNNISIIPAYIPSPKPPKYKDKLLYNSD